MASIQSLSLALKALAPIFLAVSLLHLWFGLAADAMLGASVSAETLTDPTLNSQNRFYGVAFALYGVLLLISATDIVKYQSILRAVLWVFFAAGAARIIAIVTHGVPTTPVLLLLGSELLLPPILLIWLRRALAGA